MRYVALIPARKGSKRVKNKNIRKLSEKPLVFWTIEACLKSEKIQQVIFSTDDLEYWDLVKKNYSDKRLVLDKRTNDEAGDNIKIFDYLKESVSKLFDVDRDTFILALPTAPFRNHLHINDAISLFEKSGRPVFSCSAYDFSISFAFQIDTSGNWNPTFADNPMVNGNTRSQDQLVQFRPNGAIYIRKAADLCQHNLATLYTDAVPFPMKKEHSIDIDDEIDFAMADSLASSKILF